jgi:hypothetical protein
VRVLCVSFQKAMKDNFLHCRVAGLRTANACVKMLDVAQMASKIVPQASILLLDKSAEVRSLALTLIDSCLHELRTHHEVLVEKARSEGGSGSNSALNLMASPASKMYSESPSAKRPTAAETDGSSAASPAAAATWSSWSVLQGLSETLESATIAATDGVPASAAATRDAPQVQPQSAQITTPVRAKSGATASRMSAAASAPPPPANHGESEDLSLDPDVFRDDESLGGGAGGSGSSGNKGGRSGGWDDDLDLGDDDDEAPPQQQQQLKSSTGSGRSSSAGASRTGIAALSTGSSLTTAPASTASNAGPVGMKLGSTKSATTAKAPKVAVTKLAVDKSEGWDDF